MLFIEKLIIEDLRRLYNASFKPRALIFFLTVDFWIGQLVIGPLIVLVFRGSWVNWDYAVMLISGCGALQSLVCSLIGMFLMFILSVAHSSIAEVWKPNREQPWFSKQNLIFFFVSRLFCFVSVCSDTLMWKGIWELLDSAVFLQTFVSNLVLFTVGCIILIAFRSFNACQCSTLGMGYLVDIDEEYLHMTTALEGRGSDNWCWKVLDGILTILIGTMSILIYHSLWVMIDIASEQERYGFGLKLNIFLYATLFSVLGYLIQFLNLWVHSLDIHELAKLSSHDFMLLISLVADVLMFYTIWTLMDNLILDPEVPHDPYPPPHPNIVDHASGDNKFANLMEETESNVITEV